MFENQDPLVVESHLRMVEMRSPANLGPGMVKLWRIFPLDISRTRESILYSEPTDNGYLFYLEAPGVHMEEQKGLFGNVVSRERFYDLVERRVRVLKSTDGVATFNDLFALNGLRYLIGQHTLNQCLVHLDTSVFNFDRLAGSAAKKTEAYRADHGSDFVKSLAKGDEGLSKFLVASSEDATSGSATSESAADGKNDGSGHLRASLLQRLQTMSIDESEVPEALREHYAISRKQHAKVVENIPTLEDDTLTQWVQASYTSVGQLVAEVSSEFYEMTQRIVLQEMAKAPVYKHIDTILIPLELLRAGNPFMRGGLKLTHADEFMTNPNPEMVPLGIRFGRQESGVAKFSDSALNESLKKAGGQGLLSPKGGVPNRVVRWTRSVGQPDGVTKL
ncbi:hypothetical protein EZI54_22905 [Marinobacter halodurans]|uniref:Uncharacterized protein n=1 Tax=Marinobacter halodurans TaxID=2528979 RepID=A0ABY1ZDJ2_9GAMM|nr:hypothetical protein [Marinobacter halodurans]TBW46932.1 hypothetical protein EZI54_22905 [Marinobacter halodurans]